jgi:hypothetical protein
MGAKPISANSPLREGAQRSARDHIFVILGSPAPPRTQDSIATDVEVIRFLPR